MKRCPRPGRIALQHAELLSPLKRALGTPACHGIQIALAGTEVSLCKSTEVTDFNQEIVCQGRRGELQTEVYTER
jgi:hypothetical protein